MTETHYPSIHPIINTTLSMKDRGGAGANPISWEKIKWNPRIFKEAYAPDQTCTNLTPFFCAHAGPAVKTWQRVVASVWKSPLEPVNLGQIWQSLCKAENTLKTHISHYCSCVAIGKRVSNSGSALCAVRERKSKNILIVFHWLCFETEQSGAQRTR